ncbi:response regulator [Anaerolineales bacterium HSG24]|nr:response regulator [Anaerolineales bacterium HSG24]
MRSKHILIVDDESSVRMVLKGAIKRLGSDYTVTTAKDGFAAIDALHQQAFDLVVTDFNMEGIDGLELIETVRYQQPQAKTIMITAYGYDGLETAVKQFQAYRYLTKPLEISKFRAVVKQALTESTTKHPNIFALSDAQFNTVHDILKQLQVDVNARCVFLTDANGNTIARVGDAGKIRLANLASLLGGGIASVVEAGRVLNGDTESTNLIYREGKDEYLYAANIGTELLMIVIINRGQYSSKLGSVWYYAQKVAEKLSETLSETYTETPDNLFTESFEDEFDQELDKLFM